MSPAGRIGRATAVHGHATVANMLDSKICVSSRVCALWLVALVLCPPLLAQSAVEGGSNEVLIEWALSVEEAGLLLEVVTTETPDGTRIDLVDGQGKLVERLTLGGVRLAGPPQEIESAPLPTWGFQVWAALPEIPVQGFEDPSLIFELPLFNVDSGSNLIADDTTAMRASMSADEDFMPPGDAFVFGGVDIKEADLGTVQIATLESDPSFEPVVGFLTDGNDNDLVRFYSKRHDGMPRVRTWSWISESFWFGEGPGNGIDLEGFDVERIDLRFDHILFDSPGSDPNDDGNWTDFQMDAVVIFRQRVSPIEVPALSGQGLLGLVSALGLIGLWFLGRRSRFDG